MILIHLFFLSGIIRFDRYPSVYPFGESIVSFECEDIWFSSERENKNASLEIQLQRHANDNWTTVVESNRSSVFWKSENTLFRFTILSVRVRERQYNQRVTLKGLIQSKQCTVDQKISPDFRCVLSDESGIIDSSSETRILSIEGIWYLFLLFCKTLITNACTFLSKIIMTSDTRKNAFNFQSQNETLCRLL